MASHIVSDEKSKEINDPTYLYKCKRCGEIKPNSEYSKSPNRRVDNSKGRAYVCECKSCRRIFGAQDKYKEQRRLAAPEQRRKHRMNLVFNSSKGNAKRRGLEHTITLEYLEQLYIDQKGLCFYTNKPILKDIRNEQDSNDSVSVDRIDSSKGYIEGNVVLCRWIVNRMKNDIDHSTFLELVVDIHTKFNL